MIAELLRVTDAKTQSSNIAFTMGEKGPLLEKAENYNGEIPLF